MTVKISFAASPAKSKADTAIITFASGIKLSAAGQRLDKASGGFISHHLKNQDKFSGKPGQVFVLPAPKASGHLRFVLLGVGDKAQPAEIEATGGKLAAALNTSGAINAILFLESDAKTAAHLAAGVRMRAYTFNKFKSKKKGDKPKTFSALTIVTAGSAKAKSAFAPLDAAVRGVYFARDLANEPPNLLYPKSFANIVKRELAPLGVKVEIFDEKKLAALGFESHIAVGKGSERQPHAVVLTWKGTKRKTMSKPLAFVGKGVTFDTGGISIKPAAGMEDMKFDMSGAAAVCGLMRTLAARKAKIDVVGIIGLAENMPSHNAYRPGDIIGSLSGKTIEVLNTDAEGRLVLADALTYIQRRFDPRFVVDLATLTGAIVVALGGEYAGAFVNDDKFWGQLSAASDATGESLWRMPLNDAFKKSMESQVADLRNTSTMGRDGGSCSAAGFLAHFIDDKRVWAHLDIAGTAWIKSDKPTYPKPAAGFGVRLLDKLVSNYE